MLEVIQPDEIYNLAAQSHVKVSFDMPEYTADVTAIGVLRLLDAIRELGLDERVYQAGSSEMYGKVQETPQNETTPFHPRSPYAVSKVYGHWMTVNYREGYGMHVSRHPLQPRVAAARRELRHPEDHLRGRDQAGAGEGSQLGNLDAKRDWGFAGDYVEAMWRMLQQDQPDDYVVATGETHSVRDFFEEAFGCVGLDWEHGGRPAFFRPAEVDLLLGDPARRRGARLEAPVAFKALAKLMVDADLEYDQKSTWTARASPDHSRGRTAFRVNDPI